MTNIALMAETARLRIHYAADLRAANDRRLLAAMAVVRTRGLGQLFRHARARVRAIQEGAAT